MARQVEGNEPINFTTSPVMLIVVGGERKQFWVHQKLLQAWSGFFQGCARADLIETRTNTIELLDDKSIVFDVVVTWLYHGTITKPTSHDEQIVLIEAYILADRLLMSALQNDIMDQIRSYHTEELVDTEHLETLQRLEVSVNSPLFRYYVDQYAFDLQKYPTRVAIEDDNFALNTNHAQFWCAGGALAFEVFQQIFRDIHNQAGSLAEERKDPSDAYGLRYQVCMDTKL